MNPFAIVFDTRGYELDAEARVPAHMWLHYMEHLRWEYTIRALPEVSKLFRKGHSIVVVAQTLRVIRDIGVSIPIQGSLWIGRTGRTSAVFNHAFHHADDGDLLAAGSITAVYLGLSGTPTPLPGSFFQTVPDSFEMPDFNAPEFTQMPSKPFKRTYHVRAGDLDFLKHMNQANYAALYDDARQAAATRNAYGPDGLGAGRIRFLHVEYLHPAMLGEKLVVTTWKAESDPLSLCFAMHRNATLINRATLTWGSDRGK